ncbi:MAG: hypothetical protein JST87_12210 [Bacteroidetes bacterium]|nr:hypothetical protein [Bacteroidota bacterium]
MRCITCLTFLFFLTCLTTHAQDTTKNKISGLTEAQLKDSLKEFEKEFSDLFFPKKSYFLVGIDYLSNNVYFGRKDSVASPYITPSVGYYHKSGLHVNASASYLPVSGQNRFDLFTVEAGYGYKSRHVEFSVNAYQYFFNSNSYNVESEIQQNAVLLFGYNFGFIKPVVEGILNFGNRADYGASFGLEHSFYAFDYALAITPTITAYGSTQNYYNSYYKVRRYGGTRLKRLIGRGYTINAYVENAPQFKILNYEISMPVSYIYKKFTFSFIPTYAIPQHPSVVDVTFKTLVTNITLTGRYKEQLSNTFFGNVGVGYKF